MNSIIGFFSAFDLYERFNKSKFYNEVKNFGSQSFMSKVLTVLGSYYILRNTLGFLSWAKQYLFTYEKDFKKEYGDGWVVITGSTDGIGKELAIEFTKRSHKVLLVARNEEKLKSVCEELKKIPGYRDCSYVVFDLNRNYGSEDVNEILEKFKSYKEDISILINNAGVSNIGLFSEYEYSKIDDLINVNLKAPVFFIRTLLPFLNKKDRKSLIVNNGSGLGNFHLGGIAIYCATKAFLEALTNSIAEEGYNIDTTYLSTNEVNTKMNPGESKLDSNIYAKSVLHQIGNYRYSKGHYIFSIQEAFTNALNSNLPFIYRLMKKSITNVIIEKSKEKIN